MASHNTRGAFIVVEGLDRAGKSTQCERLLKNLERLRKPVKALKFPDRTTPTGKMINEYLQGIAKLEDHVIHLLFVANRWEAAEQIRADIAAGTIVIADRYYYSGSVYTAAKGIPGLDLQWARAPEVGLPRPDICIFLDISASMAAVRGGFGDERYENVEMQARVRQLFWELRNASSDFDDFCVVDSDDFVDNVEHEVLEVALNCLHHVSSTSADLRDCGPLELRSKDKD
ncbi:MAG: Thymidylate kinase [Trizodia sp. TS-e1964]|nr:MAG: Thymidylate kinase [Trizodia sp. TS-e1964]